MTARRTQAVRHGLRVRFSLPEGAQKEEYRMGIEWIIVIAVGCAAVAALVIGLSVSAAKKSRRRREAAARQAAEPPAPAAEQAAPVAAKEEEPAAESAEEKVAEQPAAEEPAAEEPAAEEPAAEEPAVEEPAVEEPAVEEPAAEESAAEEPAAEEPVAEEPAAEEPAAEEPAAEEPAAEEPATEEPAAEEPAAEQAAPVAAKEEEPAAAEGGEKSRRTILYRMEYSYSAKLYQSSPEQKEFYSTIVQEVRSFPIVKRAVSWRQERIYAGRNKLALLVFRGKRLCIALALDPDEWEETKYHGLDVGEIKRYEKTPMMLRITSARKAKYACELLRIAAERAGLVRQEAPAEELDLPYRTTEELLDVGLIRMIANGRGGENDVYEKASIGAMIRDKVSLGEARTLISDETAKRILEESTDPSAAEEPAAAEEEEQTLPDPAEPALQLTGRQSAAALPLPAEKEAPSAPAEGKAPVRAKPSAEKEEGRGGMRGHINIDTLAAHFEPYAHVTLEAMKAKKLVPARVTRVKVLARGVLDKPLFVEAQDFSLDAVKMILLVGGRVKRK